MSRYKDILGRMTEGAMREISDWDLLPSDHTSLTAQDAADLIEGVATTMQPRGAVMLNSMARQLRSRSASPTARMPVRKQLPTIKSAAQASSVAKSVGQRAVATAARVAARRPQKPLARGLAVKAVRAAAKLGTLGRKLLVRGGARTKISGIPLAAFTPTDEVVALVRVTQSIDACTYVMDIADTILQTAEQIEGLNRPDLMTGAEVLLTRCDQMLETAAADLESTLIPSLASGIEASAIEYLVECEIALTGGGVAQPSGYPSYPSSGYSYPSYSDESYSPSSTDSVARFRASGGTGFVRGRRRVYVYG